MIKTRENGNLQTALIEINKDITDTLNQLNNAVKNSGFPNLTFQATDQEHGKQTMNLRFAPSSLLCSGNINQMCQEP